MKACYEHHNSRLTYSKVNASALESAKTKIRLLIEEGLDNDIITKDEFESMVVDDKDAGRFYSNFKIHKEHIHMTVRSLISGSNSVTENIAKYVEYHIKDNAVTHDSYLQDTPDFLRLMRAHTYS